MARVADLAPQLAVAEGACAAFAELHVRLRIQLAAAPQAPGVLGALAHRLAALQHDRPQTHLCQHQRGEQAAGAEADDHRPWPSGHGKVRRRMADEAVRGVGCDAHLAVAGQPRQHGGFVHAVGQRDVDGVAQHHRRLLARVPGAAKDRQLAQLVIGQAQAREHGSAQRALGVFERQAQFGDAQHACAGGSSGPLSEPAGVRPVQARAGGLGAAGFTHPSWRACPGSSCCACASRAPG